MKRNCRKYLLLLYNNCIFVAKIIYIMEQKMSIKEQTLQFIAKVKADPDAFIQYIETKPQRHKEDVERMKIEREQRRQKALNEWLSI